MAFLQPAYGLPLGAICFPLFGQKYGNPGFAQFRTDAEQEAFLAGLQSYQAAASFAAANPPPSLDGPPPPPALRDFYVVLYKAGSLVKQGALSQLRGCPFPPWFFGGSGVPMRPIVESGRGGHGSDQEAGSQPGYSGPPLPPEWQAPPLPPAPLAVYLAPQLAGGGWGPWLRVGPTSSEAITRAAVDTARQAFQACGIKAAAEARIRTPAGGAPIIEQVPTLIRFV